MHPAFSVIFLTTLIGAAQGLFIALFATQVGAALGWVGLHSDRFFGLGSAVSFVLAGLGLAASFFHLGRPERAWRAAACWRTSWLSREVIVLPLFMLGVLIYGIGHHFGWRSTLVLGAITSVVCIALFVCTGMIYACIKFLQEWASPLTVINFILLGCASGFTLAAALAGFGEPSLAFGYAVWAAFFIVAAFVSRTASLFRNARLKPKSSLQSAIGVRHPQVVQRSQGFMGGSFNTREFFHGKPAAFLRNIRWIFLVLVFPVPLILLAAGICIPSAALLVLAVVLQYLGLLAERWYFFAQANHPQNLYYQSIS